MSWISNIFVFRPRRNWVLKEKNPRGHFFIEFGNFYKSRQQVSKETVSSTMFLSEEYFVKICSEPVLLDLELPQRYRPIAMMRLCETTGWVLGRDNALLCPLSNQNIFTGSVERKSRESIGALKTSVHLDLWTKRRSMLSIRNSSPPEVEYGINF